MFQNDLIRDGSLRSDDAGFGFDARLNWYRALPLSSIRLFVADPAHVRVERPGGLAPGRHELSFSIASRIPYIPTRPPDVLVQEDTCRKIVTV